MNGTQHTCNTQNNTHTHIICVKNLCSSALVAPHHTNASKVQERKRKEKKEEEIEEKRRELDKRKYENR